MAASQEGKIVVPVMQCPQPRFELKATPSRKDGLSAHAETKIRWLFCEVIQSGGQLLKCSQQVMAAAQIYFQRFFYTASLKRHNPEVIHLPGQAHSPLHTLAVMLMLGATHL
eukprot:m.9338 g.9338  ORF g.9338 m.9338 type:complete len:112 (+) comp5442_c0_seq1:136-471(+)